MAEGAARNMTEHVSWADIFVGRWKVCYSLCGSQIRDEVPVILSYVRMGYVDSLIVAAMQPPSIGVAGGDEHATER
jgi:hypothetical protein